MWNFRCCCERCEEGMEVDGSKLLETYMYQVFDAERDEKAFEQNFQRLKTWITENYDCQYGQDMLSDLQNGMDQSRCRLFF